MNSPVSYGLKTSKKSIKLTLTLSNTPEAKLWLHDLVAIQLAKPGPFIARVYELDRSKSTELTGKFSPRFETFSDFAVLCSK